MALWKPTTQSSIYSNGMIQFTSDKAVDGSGDGNFGNLSCTHTFPQRKNPSWNVNLGKAYSIIAIKIANRNDNRKYATLCSTYYKYKYVVLIHYHIIKRDKLNNILTPVCMKICRRNCSVFNVMHLILKLNTIHAYRQ